MELKESIDYYRYALDISSNRTIVELKVINKIPKFGKVKSSNRTIVELKDRKWLSAGRSEISSNRTIVELKVLSYWCHLF